MEAVEGIKIDLPESVTNPKPKFKTASEAIQFYSAKLESIAHSKKLSLDELKAQANLYKFGPDESFMILGLFDSIRTLKSAE
jgi:hypothetical protein